MVRPEPRLDRYPQAEAHQALGTMADLLSDQAHEVIESAAVATLVTLDGDGGPHVSSAWIGLEDGEIVIGTLADERKLRNLRRDPRVALTVLGDRVNQWGLREYLVIN